MQKYYYDGCGSELIEMPVFSNGFGLIPIAKEVNGIFDKQMLTIDNRRYDLCSKCKDRIKEAINAELKAIKVELER